MQRQPRGSSPKLELVTLTVATMAIIATDCHVHRERATTPRPGLVQRTTSVRLHPRSIRRLEPKQAQHLLHRDLSANSVEVDAWHGCSLLGDTTAQCSRSTLSLSKRTVPFPFSLWGTGTALLGWSVQALPTSGRAAEPAGSLKRLQHLAQALVLDPQ